MAAKVLLVEDDNNLREIYEARLMAEGYSIVTARDGEEALVVAKAETPDLVISDVMMPRVSGFEMLDILRNTESLKDTKVIMLTALGQADDKTRANSLGADRYLVKSQVTLEDIVKTAHELLEGAAPQAGPAAVPPTAPAPASAAAPSTTPPVSQPVAPTPVAAPPVVTPPMPAVAPVQPAMPTPVPPVPPVAVAPAPSMPSAPGVPAPTPMMAAPMPSMPAAPPPVAPSVDEERASIGAQIDSFVAGTPAPAPVTTAAQDDAVLATAMHDLAANTATAPTPESSAPVMPAAPTQQPIVPPQSPPAAVPAPDPFAPVTATPNDSITTGSKKVIQPLGSSDTKTSIHELMAREEANGIATNSQVGHIPPAPATTISPNGPMPAAPPVAAPSIAPVVPPAPGMQPPVQPPAQPQPPAPNDFDPNSISL